MNDCVIGEDLRCVSCGRRAVSALVRRNCAVHDRPTASGFPVEVMARGVSPQRGDSPGCLPGEELAAILRDWLGIEADAGCGCKSMASRMNDLGPDWCESEAGLAEILGVMQAEHAKRWSEGRTRLPWSDFGATQLVRLACRRARAKARPAD